MSNSAKIKRKLKGLNARSRNDKFVSIPKYMQSSLGYKLLVLNCAGAITIYIELCMRYNTVNNGEISYAVREGKQNLGFNPNTVGRYLRLLEHYGFIITTQKGSFDLKKRHASTYELTMFDVIGKHKAKKSFMSYKPTPEEQKLLKKKTTVIPNKYQKAVSNISTHRYQRPILREPNGHFTVLESDT